jgi:hypothetical protein
MRLSEYLLITLKKLMTYRYLVLILVLLFIPCGCASNHGRPVISVHNDLDISLLGAEVSRELIEFSSPPLIPASNDHPVLVLTPVGNEKINSSSSFGRTLQNAMVAGFVKNGVVVSEIKLKDNAIVQPDQGEFMLSRDISTMLKSRQPAQAVVVSTYTLNRDVLYLSVRLINPENGLIRSVYEHKHRLDNNTLQMLGFKVKDDVNVIKPPRESLLNKLFY